MTDEDDFHRALDAEPANHVLRLVFSDWLEEQGDSRAEGIRWLGANGKYPHRNDTLVEGSWHWYTGPQSRAPIHAQVVPATCAGRWLLLIGDRAVGCSFINNPYPSRRAAEDAFALAYARAFFEEVPS